MSIARHFRLLPAVVIVGAGLLVIKGADIARAAQAAAASVNPDLIDNTGLAPTDTGGAAKPDYASDDATNASPAEVDVLSSLTRRRNELDARERALNMRESVLSAGEARVDQKIATLKDLQTQIQTLLAQRDAKQDAQIASLVKTYSAMKPKDAARIFNSLSDDVLIPVAKGMKSDVLAPVLASMNADAAQKLTVKLAALLKLPDTAPAVCPTPTADAAAPAPVASAAPATTTPGTPPVQTAALTPPATTPAPTPAAAPPASPPQATPPKPAPHKAAKTAPKPAATPAKPAASATPPKPVAANTTPAAAAPAAASPAPASTAPSTASAATAPPTALTPSPTK